MQLPATQVGARSAKLLLPPSDQLPLGRHNVTACVASSCATLELNAPEVSVLPHEQAAWIQREKPTFICCALIGPPHRGVDGGDEAVLCRRRLGSQLTHDVAVAVAAAGAAAIVRAR